MGNGQDNTGDSPPSVSLGTLFRDSVLPAGLQTVTTGVRIVGAGAIIGLLVAGIAISAGVSSGVAVIYGYVGLVLTAVVITIGAILHTYYYLILDLYEWVTTVFESPVRIGGALALVVMLGGGYLAGIWWTGSRVESVGFLVAFVVLGGAVHSVGATLAYLLGRLMAGPVITSVVDVDLPARTAVFVVPNIERINGFTMSIAGLWDVIYITEGAVETLSPRSLTALLGHELGHVANNDAARLGVTYLVTALVAGGLFSVYSLDPGGWLGPWVVWVGLVGIVRPLLAKWTRSREFVADEYGAQYASVAGSLELLERLQEQDQETLSPWQRLIRTHPPLSARIERLEQLHSGEQ